MDPGSKIRLHGIQTTLSIPKLLLNWWCNESRHQRAFHRPSLRQHQKIRCDIAYYWLVYNDMSFGHKCVSDRYTSLLQPGGPLFSEHPQQYYLSKRLIAEYDEAQFIFKNMYFYGLVLKQLAWWHYTSKRAGSDNRRFVKYHWTLLIKSTMVQVRAWCHQASSRYPGQCWPDLCHYMAWLGHNGLTAVVWISTYLANKCMYFLLWNNIKAPSIICILIHLLIYLKIINI